MGIVTFIHRLFSHLLVWILITGMGFFSMNIARGAVDESMVTIFFTSNVLGELAPCG